LLSEAEPRPVTSPTATENFTIQPHEIEEAFDLDLELSATESYDTTVSEIEIATSTPLSPKCLVLNSSQASNKLSQNKIFLAAQGLGLDTTVRDTKPNTNYPSVVPLSETHNLSNCPGPGAGFECLTINEYHSSSVLTSIEHYNPNPRHYRFRNPYNNPRSIDSLYTYMYRAWRAVDFDQALRPETFLMKVKFPTSYTISTDKYYWREVCHILCFQRRLM
jgi:hypothetical protein